MRGQSINLRYITLYKTGIVWIVVHNDIIYRVPLSWGILGRFICSKIRWLTSSHFQCNPPTHFHCGPHCGLFPERKSPDSTATLLPAQLLICTQLSPSCIVVECSTLVWAFLLKDDELELILRELDLSTYLTDI